LIFFLFSVEGLLKNKVKLLIPELEVLNLELEALELLQ
jgi:hypothetical protein